jgi:hypothetical protein
MRKLRAKEV